MFISDNLIFTELHKTGCTHIGKLLDSLLDGIQHGKHNLVPPQLLSSGRQFLGSVRNPWDWYVSLWAYGCGKKGLVYHLTTQTNNARKWQQCYGDSNSPAAFQDWLHMMNDNSYWHDFGEGYGNSPVASIAGLLSYRYIRLFCKPTAATINNISDLRKYERQNCFINHFIRMENLEEDFINAVSACGINLSSEQKNNIYSMQKTNTSSRKNSASYYYNQETIELVRKRENIIIKKFLYPKPEK